MNDQEKKAVIAVCILAAFADGSQSEAERAAVSRIADGFHVDNLDLAASYQDALAQKAAIGEVAARLQSQEARALAYEMAVCVCNADGAISESEHQFLGSLRSALGLSPDSTHPIEAQATLVSSAPVAVPPRLVEATGKDAELDHQILNYAILTGALELLPHSLATMAIIPLQMKMVYGIGQKYGFDLGRGHIKDFLATVGIGLTSQVVEGFARRVVGSLSRQIGGGLFGGLAGQATGSAVAFASTYALGQVAKRYYASGRTLDAAQLKEVFTSLLSEGTALQSRYSSEIAQRSRQISPSELLPLVTGRS
jgi:uncharacterized protein (DUF697 family)/tellurite resistance protein